MWMQYVSLLNYVRMTLWMFCAVAFPLSILMSPKQLFKEKTILPSKEQLLSDLSGALWSTSNYTNKAQNF